MISVSFNWALLIGLLALCGASAIVVMLTYFTCYVVTAGLTRVYRALRRYWGRR